MSKTMLSNKKNLIIIGALMVLIGAAGVLYVSQRGAQEPYVVASADGSASLSIPKNALPRGVALEDISIAKLTPEEYPEGLVELEPLAVYRMEPDGAEFEEPVSFSVIVEAEDSEWFPTAFHITKDSVEPIEGLSVEKLEDGTFAMSGTVRHFSDIFVSYGFFALEMPGNLGTYFVGESFKFPVTIYKRDQHDHRFFNRYNSTTETSKRLLLGARIAEENSTWPGVSGEIEGGMYKVVEGKDVVVPEEIKRKPPAGTSFASNSITTETTFTCAKEGEAMIEYGVLLLGEYRTESTADMDYLEQFVNFLFQTIAPMETKVFYENRAIVECVESETGPFLDYEVETTCGTSDTNGTAMITGELQHPGVQGIELGLDGNTYRPTFNSTTGAFSYNQTLTPGLHDFWIKPDFVITEDSSIYYGEFTIESCFDGASTAVPDEATDSGTSDTVPWQDSIFPYDTEDDGSPPAEDEEPTQDTSPAPEDPSGAEQGDGPMYLCSRTENYLGTCYFGGTASQEDLDAGCPDLPKCPPLDD